MPETDKVIWPVSIRLIHWIIALIVLLDAFIVEEGDAAHRYWGYLGMVLVLVRVVMGVFGSGVVLFSSFPLKPGDFKNFFFNHFNRKAHYPGHNPLASLVYIVMWILIIALGVTGWMLGLDAFWGDENLENIHAWLSDGLIILVILHLVGIVVDAFLYKRKTWMGMINGKKN